MKTVLVFFALILLVIIVEILGGIMTRPGLIEWYPTLKKPFWTPPAWIFAPVWTVLYLMMSVAFFLVWRRRKHPLFKAAAWLWGIQLFLNLIWSGLFFSFQNAFLGLIDLILLAFSLFATVIVFWKISNWAGILMMPYLLWLLYAMSLNLAIWWMNG